MSNMVVNTNVLALNSHRSLKGVGTMQAKASARLSSGLKINSAADDAAGLAISEKMRAQIRGLDMASKNSQDAISLIQTAEGGMQEIDNMLQRIRELTVQVSNDTNENNTTGTGDRQKMQDEIDQLVTEIDSMAERVEFNKKKVINGDYADPQETFNTASKNYDVAAAAKLSSAEKLTAAQTTLNGDPAVGVDLKKDAKAYDTVAAKENSALTSGAQSATNAEINHLVAGTSGTVGANAGGLTINGNGTAAAGEPLSAIATSTHTAIRQTIQDNSVAGKLTLDNVKELVSLFATDSTTWADADEQAAVESFKTAVASSQTVDDFRAAVRNLGSSIGDVAASDLGEITTSMDALTAQFDAQEYVTTTATGIGSIATITTANVLTAGEFFSAPPGSGGTTNKVEGDRAVAALGTGASLTVDTAKEFLGKFSLEATVWGTDDGKQDDFTALVSKLDSNKSTEYNVEVLKDMKALFADSANSTATDAIDHISDQLKENQKTVYKNIGSLKEGAAQAAVFRTEAENDLANATAAKNDLIGQQTEAKAQVNSLGNITNFNMESFTSSTLGSGIKSTMSQADVNNYLTGLAAATDASADVTSFLAYNGGSGSAPTAQNLRDYLSAYDGNDESLNALASAVKAHDDLLTTTVDVNKAIDKENFAKRVVQATTTTAIQYSVDAKAEEKNYYTGGLLNNNGAGTATKGAQVILQDGTTQTFTSKADFETKADNIKAKLAAVSGTQGLVDGFEAVINQNKSLQDAYDAANKLNTSNPTDDNKKAMELAKAALEEAFKDVVVAGVKYGDKALFDKAYTEATKANNTAKTAYDEAVKADAANEKVVTRFSDQMTSSQMKINELNGKAAGLHFQVGANANQSMKMSIGSVKSDLLGIGDGKGTTSINVLEDSGSDTTGILDTLDTALSYVTTERSKLGAAQNRLEYTIKSLDVSSENLSAAESRIRDTDMAKEMMSLTKSNVLQQAATSMLAQANQAPQNVLQLLG